MQTAEYVDLNRYLSKWYEIARIDSWFEVGCRNVTAEYKLIDNRNIAVINSCFDTNINAYKQARGRAWVVDKQSNSKLKVSFLPRYLKFLDALFNGDYWILKIDADYKIALVGEPSRKYLWILSRTPAIDENIYNEYVKYAEMQGYNIKKLHRTLQSGA